MGPLRRLSGPGTFRAEENPLPTWHLVLWLSEVPEFTLPIAGRLADRFLSFSPGKLRKCIRGDGIVYQFGLNVLQPLVRLDCLNNLWGDPDFDHTLFVV